MRHMPTAKHRIAVNLDDQEFAALAEMAEKHDVSLGWLGRQALLEVIDRYAIFEQKACSDQVRPARTSAARNSSCRPQKVRVSDRWRSLQYI
jgi:hypothetical protein